MADRVKRTYNLDPRTVHAVRDLVDRYGLAHSQDAVIELAVDELQRKVRDQQDADAWARAASDPAFRRESTDVARAYRSADRETWPAERRRG